MIKACIVPLAMSCILGAAGAEAQTHPRPAHHAAGPAHAAVPAPTPAAAGWTPAGCGREPVAPTVDTSTIDRYNASVDHVTAYEKAARTYNTCVSKAATLEQTAISNDARTRIDAIQAVSGGVQKRIAGNFAGLTTALRDASPKLQASSGKP